MPFPPEFPKSMGSRSGWWCLCWIHPQPVCEVSCGCPQPWRGSGMYPASHRSHSRAGMELKAPKAQVDTLTKYSLVSQSFTFLTKPPPFSRSVWISPFAGLGVERGSVGSCQ